MRTFQLPRHRGASLVEASLVALVALVAFIGIIDIGSVLFRLEGLTERARAGARYGIVNAYDAAKIQNVVVYGNSAGSGTALLGLSASYVTVSKVDLGDGVSKIRVVIASYPVRFFTPWLAMNKTLPSIEVALT